MAGEAVGRLCRTSDRALSGDGAGTDKAETAPARTRQSGRRWAFSRGLCLRCVVMSGAADDKEPRRQGHAGAAADGHADLPASVTADQARHQAWADRLDKVAKPPDSRSELRERTSRLPPGNPSSPFDEYGLACPDERPLSDHETPEPPLTDADYADHVRHVETALDKARADGHETYLRFTVDPDHEEWSPERTPQHGSIIADAYLTAADVPCERHVIIAGGLGGAGKSTVLERYAGIDMSKYVIINPDNFKEELAGRGMTPKVPGLSPMETSTLAHEESSYLARRLAMRAMAEGKNIIWDITMSSEESVTHRIADLRAAGYQRIDGVFVDIPVQTSVRRAEARHRRGHDLYLAGQGLGGRSLPADVTRAQADPQYGSINRRVFEAVKQEFDHWVIYDNSVDGQPPTLINAGGRSDRAYGKAVGREDASQ